MRTLAAVCLVHAVGAIAFASATSHPPLALSLGDLSFSAASPLDTDAAYASTGGPLVVTLDSSTRPGSASPALASALASCGGSLESFLPPRAFLVHVPSAAVSRCASAVRAVPGVVASAALPAALRSPLLAEGAAPRTLPVRVLSVKLAAAPGSAAELAADLAPLLVGSGSALVPVSSRLVLVSALVSCPDAACSLAAPEGACGGACVVSAAVIQAVAGHAAVLWTEAVAPTYASNAHARAATQTTDVVNSQDIAVEYGACGDVATECSFLDVLPFTRLGELYSNLRDAPDSAGAANSKWASILDKHRNRSKAALEAPVKRPSFSAPAAASKLRLAPALKFDALNVTPVELSSETATAFLYERRTRGNRHLQGTCTTTCSAPSCGLGYAACGGLVTPLPIALDGTGQVVNVVDSGLDWRHPFYFDNTYTVAAVKTPPLSVSSHRKVPAYWSYMDAVDDVGGHGTHVCGSVAGNAGPVANTNDAPVLDLLSGMAPLAKIIFTDVSCLTPGGCSVPPSIPSTCGSPVCPESEGFDTPADLAQLFQPVYDAGARISTNSWGGGPPAYRFDSETLDSYVSLHKDHLLIFAAGNEASDGPSPYATLSTQAIAKNVLTVGSVQDGILSHLLNIGGGDDVTAGLIPPLGGFNAPGGCGTLVRNWVASGESCPTPSPDGCALLVASGDLSANHFADLAFCCGCSPKQILDGFYAELPAAAFSAIVYLWEKQYNTRVTSSFSSRGPTLDGRIKPDVAAPGRDIVSSRSSAGARYDSFQCSATPSSVNNVVDQTLQTFVGQGSLTTLALVPMTITEATSFTTVTVPFTATTTGTLYLILVKLDSSGQESDVIPSMPIVVSTTGGPFNANFAPNIDLWPGFSGYWGIAASPNFQFSLYVTTTVTVGTQCFGTLPSAESGYEGFQMTATRARGGPLSWVFPNTGTSMATPVTAGNAALVRQYFIDGYYPSGRATAGAGFSPSAALLKAVLVNSASPVIDVALAALTSLPSPSAQEILMASGHGVINLARGLSFVALGSASRATGALVTMTLPGLGTAGGDPTIADGAATVYCIDTTAPSAAGGKLPLSVSLVWTDPAASPIALYALVNDIDLEVYLPSSNMPIYGNNNATAAPQQRDARNNVEKVRAMMRLTALGPVTAVHCFLWQCPTNSPPFPQVLLSSPASTLSSAGARLTNPYRIIVRGSTVPSGPQAYSLVVTGAGAAVSAASCGGDPFAPPTPTAAPAVPSASSLPAPASGVTPTVAALISTTVIFGLIAVGVAAALILLRVRSPRGPGASEKAQLLIPPQGDGAPMMMSYDSGSAPMQLPPQDAYQQYAAGGLQYQQQPPPPQAAPTFMKAPLQFRKPPAAAVSYGTTPVLPGEVVAIPMFASREGR